MKWKSPYQIEKRDGAFLMVGTVIGIFGTLIIWYFLNVSISVEVTLMLIGTALGTIFGLLISLAFYIIAKIDAEKSTYELLAGLEGANRDVVIKTLGDAILKTSPVWGPFAAKAVASLAAASLSAHQAEAPKPKSTG